MIAFKSEDELNIEEIAIEGRDEKNCSKLIPDAAPDLPSATTSLRDCVVIAVAAGGMYFYARMRTEDVRKEVR